MDEKEILGFQTYVQVWPLIKHSQGPDFFISRLICCFSVKKKPNQKIDYRHKFESSTFAFVRFEISTLLKLEISTLQKLEISSFRRVENFKLQKGWNQTQKQMIQANMIDHSNKVMKSTFCFHF